MLTIIPACGGSKGIPGKNLLLKYKLEEEAVAGVDVYVSSDDEAMDTLINIKA